VFVVLALAGGVASANGRPPATVGITTRPGNSTDLYVGTTFGLLISHDDGCSFQWVCEQSIGYGGTFDPKYAVAHDGTIYATTFDGLRVSRDGGCSFTTAGIKQIPNLEGVWVDALELGPDDDVWIGTAESAGANDVYHSTDAAHTFRAMGLRSSTIWWKSVRVAPSNPQRVYVSGYQVASTRADLAMLPEDQRPPGKAAFLLRSDDRGTTWQQMPLTDMAVATTPVVLLEAVDPLDGDIVFARSLGANPPSGDRLYRSTDGGATWDEVLVSPDAIRKVLFTHDHRVLVATITSGVFASTDGGQTFAPLADQPQTACLAERSDNTLFACGTNWEPDFMALGRSNDATGWQKTFRFVELAGPLQCPHRTAQYEQCELLGWPVLREQFTAVAPACAAQPDAPGPPPGDGGGCCDASAGGPASALAGIALYLVAGLRRRRRAR
jgi:uncharacterized protein (TIGR03382 family)